MIYTHSHTKKGENIVIAGLNEDSVLVGQVLSIGSTALQVTVPRTPCKTFTFHFGCTAENWEQFQHQFLRSGRTGWYLRVLKEGYIHKDDPVYLLKHSIPHTPTTLYTHYRTAFLTNARSLFSGQNLSSFAVSYTPPWSMCMALFTHCLFCLHNATPSSSGSGSCRQGSAPICCDEDCAHQSLLSQVEQLRQEAMKATHSTTAPDSRVDEDFPWSVSMVLLGTLKKMLDAGVVEHPRWKAMIKAKLHQLSALDSEGFPVFELTTARL